MQNPKKILICDDYKLRAESLRLGFEQRGYAASGEKSFGFKLYVYIKGRKGLGVK